MSSSPRRRLNHHAVSVAKVDVEDAAGGCCDSANKWDESGGMAIAGTGESQSTVAVALSEDAHSVSTFANTAGDEGIKRSNRRRPLPCSRMGSRLSSLPPSWPLPASASYAAWLSFRTFLLLAFLASMLWPAAVLVSYMQVASRRSASELPNVGRYEAAYSHSAVSVAFPRRLVGGIALPGPFSGSDRRRARRHNFGQIEYYSIAEEEVFARLIPQGDGEMYHEERRKYLKAMAKKIGRGGVSKREPGRVEHYDEIDYPADPEYGGCYRLKWSYAVHP